MAARLSRAITAIAQRPEDCELPPLNTLETQGFICDRSIRSPIRRRVQAAPRVITQAEIDPRVYWNCVVSLKSIKTVVK